MRISAPRLERKGASLGSDARPFRGGLAALGVACLSAFSAIEADAEVRVEGNRDEMHVRVENAWVMFLKSSGQNVVALLSLRRAAEQSYRRKSIFGFLGTSSAPTPFSTRTCISSRLPSTRTSASASIAEKADGAELPTRRDRP